MNTERSLLSKAIQTGKLEKLVAIGIDETHFYEEDCKEAWISSVAHLKKYKTAPSLDALRKANSDFKFELVPDAFDYIVEEFIKVVKRRKAIDGLRELARATEDTDRILTIDEEILELGAEIAQLFPTGNIARYSDMEQRIQDYDERVDEGKIMGIPMGITAIDEVTFGIKSHEFVSVVGWQGLGKSTLVQHMCFSAYLAGFTPLIISLEMESGAMLERFDQMAVNFQTRAYRALDLGEGDQEKWKEWADRAKRVTNDILVVDDVQRCTVEKVRAIGQQYQPDLLVVDYVSLMDAPRGNGAMWEKVTHLTQNLKLIARDPKGPPIIGVAQTNIGSADDGAKLENIAYSRSIGQDSDIVLGLHQDEQMKSRNEMTVRMLKNRSGPQKDASMYWNPDRMEFREWKQLEDMFNKGELDDEA